MDNMKRTSFPSSSYGKMTPAFPLSVTYEEVLNRSPKNLQQLYKAEPKRIYRSEDVIIEEEIELEPSKSSRLSWSHGQADSVCSYWFVAAIRVQKEKKNSWETRSADHTSVLNWLHHR